MSIECMTNSKNWFKKEMKQKLLLAIAYSEESFDYFSSGNFDEQVPTHSITTNQSISWRYFFPGKLDEVNSTFEK